MDIYTALTMAYTEVVGSSPDILGESVIIAIEDDSEDCAQVLACWAKICERANAMVETPSGA